MASSSEKIAVEGTDRLSAVVIGTGFGGAVAACRLSQAGFAPLVLERGRRYEAGDFPALPPSSRMLPDTRRLAWGPDQGLVDVQDLGEIVSVQAAGYGGGSLLYANVQLRPPAEIFEQAIRVRSVNGEAEQEARVWPSQYTRQNLDPYYDLVASMLDVAPITEHAAGSKLVKADQLMRAATALGRNTEFFHPPLALSRQAGVNAHGKHQHACIHCGACCMGCPHQAKNSLDYNYLAVAEAHGARIKTQSEVVSIESCSHGYRVHFIDHLRARRECVETECLFLCAGAVHSTRLLASAKLGTQDHARPKSRVGLGYWPNADAFGVVFDTEHPQHPSWGPTITTTTVFADRSAGSSPGDSGRGWFLVQDGGYARELERMIGVFRSPIWAGRNRFSKPRASMVVKSAYAPPAREQEPGAPPLLSTLDGVLDAWSSGELAKAVPEQLEKVLPAIRDAASRVFFPVLVEDTIERAVRHRLRFVLRWLPEDSWLARVVLSIARRLTRTLGSPAQIARYAQDSLEQLGGLSRSEFATRLLGYGDAGADHRVMLLAMGPDSTPGVLQLVDGKLTADLDLFHLAPRYLDEELAMRDIATALGGELRVNPAWAFLGKPITVHSQGGCRLSDTEESGVANADGEVWQCPGLYVLDGSSLCSSVGVNPSSTIAAIAERNVLKFIQKRRPGWPDDDDSPGAELYRQHRQEATRWATRARDRQWTLEPPAPSKVEYRSKPTGIAFDERMQGFHAEITGYEEGVANETDEAYRLLEIQGRPSYPLELHLTPHVENFAGFVEDFEHRMNVMGTVTARLYGDDTVRRFPIDRGSLRLFHVASTSSAHAPFRGRYKEHALVDAGQRRTQGLIAGSYTSSSAPAATERRMSYELEFKDHRGAPWQLIGYKRIKNDPGFDAWRDTTTLFVRLISGDETRTAGAVHIDLAGFVAQLRSMRVTSGGTEALEDEDADPARIAWTLFSFAQFFFGSLQRIYLPEVGTALDALFRPTGRVD